MITYNDYVEYRPLHSKNEVWEWIRDCSNEELYSNKTDYQKHIIRLLEYKDAHLYKYKENEDKRSYKNIYAHLLTIMIPKNLTPNQKCEFAKKFAISFDPRYKLLTYCYKFIHVGNGEYIEFMMFTRTTFLNGKRRLLKHTDTYYQDATSKKRCSKDHPNAVLKHLKGEAKLDKDGNKQYETIYVQKKEAKIFKYRSFKKFITAIKREVRYVAMILTKNCRLYRKFSLVKIENTDNILTVQKKLIKNKMLIRINSELNFLQCAIYEGYFDDKATVKAFNKMLFRINKIIYNTNIKINERSPEVYAGYKQSFVNFREAHIQLEDHILSTYIEEFKKNYIYDYTLIN